MMKTFTNGIFLILICGVTLISCTTLPPANSDNQYPKEQSKYFTPSIWEATKTTFTDGRLKYYKYDVPIAPGSGSTLNTAEYLAKESVKDFRDTFLELPSTLKTIYETGILQNYFEFKEMAFDNWNYSKLAAIDFSNAKEAYIKEGNWGLFQAAYHSLKGTSRVVWALGVLNSSEAMYKIGKATVQTVYYLFKYPVSGSIEAVATPIVLTGGIGWSFTSAVVTTGWVLPISTTADTGIFIGTDLWEKN